jgi:putative MFS transporter
VVTHLIVDPEAFHHVFMMFTLVLLAVAAVILMLGEETQGKTLESIGL